MQHFGAILMFFFFHNLDTLPTKHDTNVSISFSASKILMDKLSTKQKNCLKFIEIAGVDRSANVSLSITRQPIECILMILQKIDLALKLYQNSKYIVNF